MLTRHRLARLAGFATTQVGVQAIGFVGGIVLVRAMKPEQYGYYTLALSLGMVAGIVGDLGLGSSVLAVGGPLRDEAEQAALVAQARRIHRRVASAVLLILLPVCFLALRRQSAAPLQAALLAALLAGTAWIGVDNGILLSLARLRGRVALQQKSDLAVNLAKLMLFMLASLVWLDATSACLVNLCAVAALAVTYRRELVLPDAGASGAPYGASLRRLMWRQGPNSVFFVFNSQISVWLISAFGNTQRVAEVGALGRLAATFSVIGAVTAGLVLPYFARLADGGELRRALAAVNGFHAALLASLVGAALQFPGTFLWILGGHYGALQSALPWMVGGSVLGAWSGTLYGIGCARGWVLPLPLSAGSGLLATVLAALCVDLASVRGSFQIATAAAGAGLLVNWIYLNRQLRRAARQGSRP